MRRTIFDWFMIAVCAVIIVMAIIRPLDPMRRTLMIGASVVIGVRRGASLWNTGGG
jgi:hypothetical protein